MYYHPLGKRPSIPSLRNAYDKRQGQFDNLKSYNVSFNFSYQGEVVREKWNSDHFIVTITNESTKKSMKIDYYTGIGHRINTMPESVKKEIAKCSRSIYAAKKRDEHTVIVPPEAYNVLYSIMMDDVRGESFENWALELGYDPDSRKALAMYIQCQEQTDTWRKTFPKFNLHEFKPLEDY